MTTIPEPGAPRAVHRGAADRCIYACCRTYLFEFLFTFIPCALIVLIVAGVYEFEETTRVTSHRRVLEHSISPVALALSTYFDRTARLAQTIRSHVESGSWLHFTNLDELARLVLPHVRVNSDVVDNAGLNPFEGLIDAPTKVEQKVSVVAWGTDWTSWGEYMSYSSEYMAAREVRQFPPVDTYRDRFIDFTSHLSALGRYGPNTSLGSGSTPSPWNPTLLPAGSSYTFEINQVSSVPRFGLRFNAQSPYVAQMGGSFVSYALRFFVELNQRELLGDALPSCSTGVLTAIVESMSWKVVAYNCMADSTWFDFSVNDFPDLAVLNDAPIAASNNSLGANIRTTLLTTLSTSNSARYYFVSINVDVASPYVECGPAPPSPGDTNSTDDGSNSTTSAPAAPINGTNATSAPSPTICTTYLGRSRRYPWSGHDRAAAAFNARLASVLQVKSGIETATRERMATVESVADLEEYLATVLSASPTIGAVHMSANDIRGPSTSYTYRFQVTRNAWGERIFRTTRYTNRENHADETSRYFVTPEVVCDVVTMSEPFTAAACSAINRINDRSAAFLTGFDDYYAFIPRTPPPNLYLPEVAQRLSAFKKDLIDDLKGSIVFDIADTSNSTKSVGLWTLAKVPQLPAVAEWSSVVNPDYALVHVTTDTREVRETMASMLGPYAGQGEMSILTADRQPIFYEGDIEVSSQDSHVSILQGLTLSDWNYIKRKLTNPAEPCIHHWTFTTSTITLECDALTNRTLAVMIRFATTFGADVIAVSKFRSFVASDASWFMGLRLPSEYSSTVTTTEKLVGAAAVFFAFVFLVANGIYVVYVVIQTTQLKRFMRRIAADPFHASTVFSLSGTTEVRAIQLAVLKLRFATLEYSKFLPSGMEHAEFEDDRSLRFTTTASASLPLAVASGTTPADRSNVYAASNGTGDAEMTGIAPSASASNVVPPSAEGVSKTGGKRTIDNLLLSHQVGLAPREMCVLALDIVDCGGLVQKMNPGGTAVLLTRISDTFAQKVGAMGGMLLPPGSGAGRFCAVWSRSSVSNVNTKACTAAINTANVLAKAMCEDWLPAKKHLPFQISLCITFGQTTVGNVGDSDAFKTSVFAGPAFDESRQLLRATQTALRKVGCRARPPTAAMEGRLPPLNGCPVGVVISEIAARELERRIAMFPIDLDSAVLGAPRKTVSRCFAAVGIRALTGPGSVPRADGEAATAEQSGSAAEDAIAEAMTSNVKPTQAMLRDMLSRCEPGRILTAGDRPFSLAEILPASAS